MLLRNLPLLNISPVFPSDSNSASEEGHVARLLLLLGLLLFPSAFALQRWHAPLLHTEHVVATNGNEHIKRNERPKDPIISPPLRIVDVGPSHVLVAIPQTTVTAISRVIWVLQCPRCSL